MNYNNQQDVSSTMFELLRSKQQFTSPNTQPEHQTKSNFILDNYNNLFLELKFYRSDVETMNETLNYFKQSIINDVALNSITELQLKLIAKRDRFDFIIQKVCSVEISYRNKLLSQTIFTIPDDTDTLMVLQNEFEKELKTVNQLRVEFNLYFKKYFLNN